LKRSLTLGSLFDGIGGFPLAGTYAGITPVWASEVEPFPIRVTAARFPAMKHYGDIRSLNGGELEPVDIITFGSPCTDLSSAGKRAGIHGGQSSLFFEAIRIITEMREKTNGHYPRWAVWENVPGAMSSRDNGRDFREVLQSLVRVKNPAADVPVPENGRWLPAGEILGEGHSLAWRVLDAAQGWGVAQRRRRVFAVVDFDGTSAGKVLFESEGVSGYTPPREKSREDAAGNAAAGAGGGRGGEPAAIGFEPGLVKRMGGHAWPERAGTLRATSGDNRAAVAYGIGSDKSRGMLSNNPRAGVYKAETSKTIDRSGGDPARHQGGMAIVSPAYCMTVGSFAQALKEQTPTLEARGYKDPPVVGGVSPHSEPVRYVARRLTPGECCLLQGYPPGWTECLGTDAPTEDELETWRGIFTEWYRAQGKQTGPPGTGRLMKWLKDPRSDSAEYKAYGNSVAVPCVFFVLAGIVWAKETEG
jgi:DNA (cytosine-5)-methyltransferase 1